MSGAQYETRPQLAPRPLPEAIHHAVTNGAGQATKVEQSRAVAEVQAAVLVAQNRPRSQAAAIEEMRTVCRIPSLAERAFFKFNRGGSVEGETVHLARELARIWGNITFGIAEMARDDVRGQSEMLAFAWDMQTNARSQTVFIVPHIRDTRSGPKAMTDVRDIYENNANMGARRLREMVFAVLPIWFREEAAAICKQTLIDGGGLPLVQRVANVVMALEGIGVSRADIERKTGKKIDELMAQDVVELGVSFNSIRRGEIDRAIEFPREEAAPTTTKPADKMAALEDAAAPIIGEVEACANGAALTVLLSNKTWNAKVAKLPDDDKARVTVAVNAARMGFERPSDTMET